MADDFQTYREGLESPASNYFSITPSDVTDFDQVTRYIYVGGTGDIACVAKDGSVVVFTAVQVGTVLPVRAVRVNATSTTATNLVGMF